MKLEDLEDAEKIVTKEYFEMKLRAELAGLELRITQQIVQSERATRAMIYGAYGLICGTYALIVGALLVNHFWK